VSVELPICYNSHCRLTDLNASSGLPDPIAPLTALARLASEYCLNLNGLVSLDNHHLLRNRYATTRSGDLHQKDYAKGIGGDSSGTGQSTRVSSLNQFLVHYRSDAENFEVAIKTLRGKLPGDLDSIKVSLVVVLQHISDLL